MEGKATKVLIHVSENQWGLWSKLPTGVYKKKSIHLRFLTKIFPCKWPRQKYYWFSVIVPFLLQCPTDEVCDYNLAHTPCHLNQFGENSSYHENILDCGNSDNAHKLPQSCPKPTVYCICVNLNQAHIWMYYPRDPWHRRWLIIQDKWYQPQSPSLALTFASHPAPSPPLVPCSSSCQFDPYDRWRLAHHLADSHWTHHDNTMTLRCFPHYWPFVRDNPTQISISFFSISIM